MSGENRDVQKEVLNNVDKTFDVEHKVLAEVNQARMEKTALQSVDKTDVFADVHPDYKGKDLAAHQGMYNERVLSKLGSLPENMVTKEHKDMLQEHDNLLKQLKDA